MQVLTIVGTVENGQIKLSEKIDLPENTLVYVVVPSIQISQKTELPIEFDDDYKIVSE